MNKIRLMIIANKVYYEHLWKNAKLVIFFEVSFLFSSNIFTLIQLYAPKLFIDEVTINGNLLAGLFWIILLAISQFYNFIRTQLFINWKKKHKMEAEFESIKDAYDKFKITDLSFFENSQKIDVFYRGLQYSENGGHATYTLMVNIIASILSSCVIFSVSLQFGWWLCLVFIAAFFAKLLISKKCERLNFVFNRDRTLPDRRIQCFSDILKEKTTFQEGRIYDSIDFFLEKCISEKRIKYKDEKKHNIRLLKYNGAALLINKVIDVMCYAVIGYALINKGATLGDYALFFATCSKINSTLDVIKATFIMYFQESNNVENYREFLSICEDNTIEQVKTARHKEIKVIKNVKFECVSFHYNNQTVPAINNVSLTINAGERISVVGLNGAGKTTFIKLLLGLYKPESGMITVNNYTLDNSCLKDYWKRVSVIFQDYKIYPLTILENILFGNNQSESSVKSAMEKADIYRKINTFEKGYDTNVFQSFFEDGIDLSGGEKQRIAIARAFAKDADLYVFDEPSSALDAVTEEKLYQIINSISQNKTVIFISHRLSSVSSTNRIIMFENGKIVGDGTHEELMQDCYQYNKLYNTQAKRYG